MAVDYHNYLESYQVLIHDSIKPREQVIQPNSMTHTVWVIPMHSRLFWKLMLNLSSCSLIISAPWCEYILTLLKATLKICDTCFIHVYYEDYPDLTSFTNLESDLIFLPFPFSSFEKIKKWLMTHQWWVITVQFSWFSVPMNCISTTKQQLIAHVTETEINWIHKRANWIKCWFIKVENIPIIVIKSATPLKQARAIK